MKANSQTSRSTLLPVVLDLDLTAKLPVEEEEVDSHNSPDVSTDSEEDEVASLFEGLDLGGENSYPVNEEVAERMEYLRKLVGLDHLEFFNNFVRSTLIDGARKPSLSSLLECELSNQRASPFSRPGLYPSSPSTPPREGVEDNGPQTKLSGGSLSLRFSRGPLNTTPLVSSDEIEEVNNIKKKLGLRESQDGMKWW